MNYNLIDFPDRWEGANIDELLRDGSVIPNKPGVYCVLYQSQFDPIFIHPGTGGNFKDKDPNVQISILENRWVDQATVIYIGQTSNSLRKRILTYLRFGEGKDAAHYGGRYIWQIKDNKNLVICWKEIEGKSPASIETEMIQGFKNKFGRNPFANLLEGNQKPINDGKSGMKRISNDFVSNKELIEALRNDISMMEGSRVEFKAGFFTIDGPLINGKKYDITFGCLKSIAGFWNTDGGRLYLGVDDDGTIRGLEMDYSTLKSKNQDQYRRSLFDKVDQEFSDGKLISPQLKTNIIKIEENEVCRIDVPPGEYPLYLKMNRINLPPIERFFIRRDNSTQDLSDNPKTMNEYIRRRFYHANKF